MKARLRRRIDLRADIAARDRVHFVAVHAPLAKRDHVGFVEFAKALLGKLPGRAELAGAERGERPAGRSNDGFDPGKALHQRHRRAKATALDLEARGGRDAARKLKSARNEAISARLEFLDRRHVHTPP